MAQRPLIFYPIIGEKSSNLQYHIQNLHADCPGFPFDAKGQESGPIAGNTPVSPLPHPSFASSEAHMIYLKALRREEGADSERYPLSAPVCRQLTRVVFDRPVTIIVGENGTGKTTLMEILAAKVGAVAISHPADAAAPRPREDTFTRAQGAFRIEMARRPERSFFFKAEDFTRYIDAWRRMDQDAREGLEDVDRRYAGRSDYARGLASMPYHRTLDEMSRLYEDDITTKSHGESFLTFFGSRIVEGGLYFMDEPEASRSVLILSPIICFSMSLPPICRSVIIIHHTMTWGNANMQYVK